jgi:hypothetical protein
MTWGFPFGRQAQRETGRMRFVALRLTYLIFIRFLGALALLVRSDISEKAETLLLRHHEQTPPA